MLLTESGEWQNVARGRKAGPGQVKGSKPALAQVWSEMEWHETGRGKVGLLKHFLGALKLPLKNPGSRAATLNALLRKAGKPGRLVEKKLKTKTGPPPWVASRDTFRDLYQLY